MGRVPFILSIYVFFLPGKKKKLTKQILFVFAFPKGNSPCDSRKIIISFTCNYHTNSKKKIYTHSFFQFNFKIIFFQTLFTSNFTTKSIDVAFVSIERCSKSKALYHHATCIYLILFFISYFISIIHVVLQSNA